MVIGRFVRERYIIPEKITAKCVLMSLELMVSRGVDLHLVCRILVGYADHRFVMLVCPKISCDVCGGKGLVLVRSSILPHIDTVIAYE